jgi:hypothetical protein
LIVAVIGLPPGTSLTIGARLERSLTTSILPTFIVRFDWSTIVTLARLSLISNSGQGCVLDPVAWSLAMVLSPWKMMSPLPALPMLAIV